MGEGHYWGLVINTGTVRSKKQVICTYVRIYVCTYFYIRTCKQIDCLINMLTWWRRKRGRRRKLLYPHPNLSLGLVPYRPLEKVDIVFKKNDVLDYSCIETRKATHEQWNSHAATVAG